MINNNEILNFFIIGVPESIVLTVFTIIILRLRIEWNKTIYISLFIALTVLLFRILMLGTGIHTAVAVITMALLVAHFYRVTKLNALIASVICFIFLNILEFTGFSIYKFCLGFDINDLAQNRWHWIITAWVKIIVVAITAFLLTKSSWYRRKNKH